VGVDYLQDLHVVDHLQDLLLAFFLWKTQILIRNSFDFFPIEIQDQRSSKVSFILIFKAICLHTCGVIFSIGIVVFADFTLTLAH
jgi:hypothetical protein